MSAVTINWWHFSDEHQTTGTAAGLGELDGERHRDWEGSESYWDQEGEMK